MVIADFIVMLLYWACCIFVVFPYNKIGHGFRPRAFSLRPLFNLFSFCSPSSLSFFFFYY